MISKTNSLHSSSSCIPRIHAGGGGGVPGARSWRGGTDFLSAAPHVFAPAVDFELAIKSKPG